jgi:hypothetical protein
MTRRRRPAPSRIPFNPYLARERFVERMRRPHPVTPPPKPSEPTEAPVEAHCPSDAKPASQR